MKKYIINFAFYLVNFTTFAGDDNINFHSHASQTYRKNSNYSCNTQESYSSSYIRSAFYDIYNNYVMFYQDDSFSVAYTNNVNAYYHVNGIIQTTYVNGTTAVYEPEKNLTTYCDYYGCPLMVSTGFPHSIPNYYPDYSDIQECQTHPYTGNKKYSFNKSSKNKERNIKNSKQLENTSQEIEEQQTITPSAEIENVSNTKTQLESNPISDEQQQKKQTWADILKKPKEVTHIITTQSTSNPEEYVSSKEDQEIIPEQLENISSEEEKQSLAEIVKKYSPAPQNNQITIKRIKSIKKLPDFYSLNNHEKQQLGNIESLSELKKAIHKGDTNTKHNFLTTANVFRHSENSNAIIIAKYILKYLISDKKLAIDSKKKAHIYLSKIKSHNNDFKSAVKKLKKGITIFGKNAEHYYFMGNNYFYLQKEDKAINSWLQALECCIKQENKPVLTVKIYDRLSTSQNYHQNNFEVLKNLYQNIIHLIESNRNLFYSIKNKSDFVKIYHNTLLKFANLYLNNDDYENALRWYKQYVSVIKNIANKNLPKAQKLKAQGIVKNLNSLRRKIEKDENPSLVGNIASTAIFQKSTINPLLSVPQDDIIMNETKHGLGVTELPSNSFEEDEKDSIGDVITYDDEQISIIEEDNIPESWEDLV